MGGKPFHAPVSNPKKIVDIGCGTGAMTYLLAKMYPDARVIGVDFSAIPDSRYDQLENIEYVQADILVLMRDGQDPRFKPGSFDYVFQRLLAFGVTDWSRYISDVTGLLKPGGWLEVQEPSVNCTRGDGSPLSESWWHYPKWRADAVALGLDVEVGPKLFGLLKQTGELNDISEAVYRFPPFARPDRPELDGLGDRILPMLTGVMRKTSSTRRSEEELGKMVEDLQSVFAAGFADDDGYQFYAVTGQKRPS